MCSGQRINAITIPEEMLKGREFEDYVIEELLQIGKKESILRYSDHERTLKLSIYRSTDYGEF